MRKIVTFFLICLLPSLTTLAAPANFSAAKVEARRHIYHDQNHNAGGDLYCGCDWEWTGRSGGRMDLSSCGYQTRAQPVRAQRLEWEHIVPASNFGRARQCWQQGGRKNCTANDPVFSIMEADLHNLAPAIGEINADRQNYNFGMIGQSSASYGACDFKVDFQNRTAEPKDEEKGMLARVYFYMHDYYNLPMSQQQQRLLMQWHKQYPPTPWEIERDRRIATRMGHNNPFVTGESQWTIGHKNSQAGLRNLPASTHVQKHNRPAAATTRTSTTQASGVIKGNRNSNVYHLPTGCPSYDRVAAHNVVIFNSEAEAQRAGYRKAGNCSR